MKNLDTAPITLSAGMPVKAGTLQFLQWMNRELFSELIAELYPNLAVESYVSAVRGCTWVKSAGTYTLQPGCIYVGGNIGGAPPATVPVAPYTTGELFLLPSVQTVTPSDHAILVVSTTQYAPGSGIADPVLFTDGSSQNVHDIRTLTLADGDSTTAGFVCYLDNGSVNPELLYAQPVGYTGYTEALLSLTAHGSGNAFTYSIVFNGTGLTFGSVNRSGTGSYLIAMTGSPNLSKTVLVGTLTDSLNLATAIILNMNPTPYITVETQVSGVNSDSFGAATILVRIYN